MFLSIYDNSIIHINILKHISFDKICKIKCLSVLFLIILPSFCLGQSGSISGIVLDNTGDPLPGVHIYLEPINKFAVSDSLGKFNLKELENAEYTIRFSYIGFQEFSTEVQLREGEFKNLEIILQESISNLNEITVTGKSESRVVKESIASVSLVNAQTFYSRSSENVDILNTVPGVQVKQSGGLGNSSEVSIQGLSGRQVKFFLDGVPMEFLYPVQELGIGTSLSMIPVSSIERMEVYKGSVPVSLGADALGGAINIVSRKDVSEFADFSLQSGSFNTRQASLGVQKLISSGVYMGFSGFYSASKNNYTVDDVTIVNDFGNPESVSVEKFHDQFESYLLNGKIGVTDKNWADQAELSVSQGMLYDEIQHNFEMRQPYGQALNKADIYNLGFIYKKNNILNRLDSDFFIGFNQLNTSFVDTTLNIYDWQGNIVGQKNYGGEITTSQNNLKLKGSSLTSKLAFTYNFNDSNKLIINGVTSYFRRTGSDPVAAEYYEADFFKEPVDIFKTVLGTSFEGSLWNNKLTHQTSFKLFQYSALGFEIVEDQAVSISQNKLHLGYGESLKWQISNQFISKISYEFSTRMPDRIESLGDFSSAIAANPNLKPETSHNINTGIQYNSSRIKLETSGFFKDVDDIIVLNAVPPPVLSTYNNLLKVRVLGVDGEVLIQPYSWISVKVNATFQDIRNRSSKINAGVSSDRYFGVRLPNKPYLFGGGELNLTKKNFFAEDDKLQGWWNTNYVEEYFRYWEIDGRKQDKLTIPTQKQHNVGISYQSSQSKYNLTFELKNIFNQNAYDHFRVQKPGRSWQLKFRLFIKNI